MAEMLPPPDPAELAEQPAGAGPQVAASPRVERNGIDYLWIAAFVALVVCTNLANGLFAQLVADHPLQLVALSARNRYTAMTAVSSDVRWWSWGLVAVARLGVAAFVCVMIGRRFGDQALRWFWRFLGMKEEGVRQFEKQYDTAELFLVPLFVGSNLVFVLAGAARSSWRKLVPLFLIGAVARLALIWWLAHRFESPLRRAVSFLTRYQWPIIAISVALVLLANLRNFRRGSAR